MNPSISFPGHVQPAHVEPDQSDPHGHHPQPLREPAGVRFEPAVLRGPGNLVMSANPVAVIRDRNDSSMFTSFINTHAKNLLYS